MGAALLQAGVSWWISLKQIFQNHWLALSFAIVVALLIGGPSVLAVRALGASYQGTPFLYQDSELVYLARIHDVIDGHPSLGSPTFYEYKATPTEVPPTGEYAYAVLKYVTFLPLNDIIVASKFIFPFVLFLLVYACAYVLARALDAVSKRLTALAAASLVLLGYTFTNPLYSLSLFKAGSSVLTLSLWSRLVNPITGAILLFAFILAGWGVMRKKRGAVIVAGIALGFSSGYVFSFAIALVAALMLAGALSLQKRYAEARGFIYTVIIGGLVNAFQFPSVARAITSPDAEMFSLRNGLLLTHTPLLDKELLLAAVVSAIAAWIYYRYADPVTVAARDALVLFASLFAASFVLMNQQVITGRTVWPEHFVQYTIPISYVALTVLISAALTRVRGVSWQYVWRVALVLAIIASFAFGLRTLGSYKAVLPDFADMQRAAPAMQWLDTNAPKDCVVFAVEDAERLAAEVPALSDCNSYWSSYVFVGVPESRIEHDYLMRLRFAGVTAAQAPAFIHDHNDEYRSVFFTDWKELFWYSNDRWLMSISDRRAIFARFDALEATLASDYDQELKGDFHTQLLAYRLDYVIWDSEKYPDWNPKNFPFLQQVYGAQGIFIYSVQQ